MSDMKIVTMRDLNRNTAEILDALERGQTFEGAPQWSGRRVSDPDPASPRAQAGLEGPL
jgi:hypothetical protein